MNSKHKTTLKKRVAKAKRSYSFALVSHKYKTKIKSAQKSKLQNQVKLDKMLKNKSLSKHHHETLTKRYGQIT